MGLDGVFVFLVPWSWWFCDFFVVLILGCVINLS